MKYSIIIPAYNESDKIVRSLTQVTAFMREFADEFNVYVVDDGSLDNTANLVTEFSKANPEVILIKIEHKGKAAAIITGMLRADGDLLYMCDADLATPITELKKMTVWLFDHDYDVVIASREGTGAVRIGEPYYRHFIGRVFNLLVQLTALWGISDSQCGFKLFKREVAKDVFNSLVVYGPNAKKRKKPFFGAFDVEVLFLAKKAGYKIKELPVTWHYVKTSRLNFFDNSYNMALDVLKIRLNSLRGKYSIERKVQ